MIKSFLTAILCLFASALSAQKTDGFQKELSDFRYLLYKDITHALSDSMPNTGALEKLIYCDPVISAKIKAFMDENRKKIVAYKTDLLKKWERTFEIDTALYHTEPSMVDEINSFWGKDTFTSLLPYEAPTIEFITMDPAMVGSLFGSMVSGRKGTSSLVVHTMATQIASPKIHSRHIKGHLWEVVHDYYWYIIVMEMDAAEGSLSTSVKTVYRLKGLPNGM